MNLDTAEKLFCDLLRIPSVTGTAAEGEVVRFLARTLTGMGLSPQLLEGEPGRPNLLARIKAERPQQPPLILLSHLDVAPVTEAEWSFPPFCGDAFQGSIRGRGSLDTKHLTVMQVYALASLLEQKHRLIRDIWLVATIDEEKGSEYGAAFLSRTVPGLFCEDSLVINEGGGFPGSVGGKPFITVTAGEKGFARLRISATGKAGHPGAPPENQAIVKLSGVLERIFNGIKEFLPVPAVMSEHMLRITGVQDHMQIDDTALRNIAHYASSNTAGIRNYKVGERENLIPAHVSVEIECKLLPGVTEEQLVEFIGQCAGTCAEWELLSFEPGFLCRDEELFHFLQTAESCCAKEGFEVQALPMLALGRTDGRFFGLKQARVYGFSPLLPVDSFSAVLKKVHGKDESVGQESFRFGCRVLRDLCEQFAFEPLSGK